MKKANITLDVYINRKFCGIATKIDFNHLCFQYDVNYVNTETPLSLSMPIVPNKKYKNVFRNWVLNLRPENPSILKDMARRGRFDENDLFAYLQAYGKDCAGAVRFLTHEESLALANTSNEYIEITEAMIGDKLVRLLDDSSFSGLENGEHKSVAGVQQKLTLHRRNNKWYLVYGNIPSTHIIKPGIKNFDNEPLVEYLTMKIFANVGLNTAEVEYHVFGNQPALVVKRYDRKQINGVWERVHQEDMCQAAGVTPSDKYESEQIGASMNLEKIISIINTYSGQTIQYNIDQLFRWCICSYLIGNTDNHAKNCAIILSGNEAKLAPFYDVASVYGFNKEAKYNTFGIYFAGCKQLNQMTKQNLLSLCDLFNKNSKGIDSEINQLYNDLLNSIVLTRGEYMHINGVNEICDEIIVKVQKCFKTLK